MGRFEHRKGIDILIKSFIEISRINTELQLFLVGNSDFLIIDQKTFVRFNKWIKSLNIPKNIRSRIHILPQINDKDKLIRLLIKLKGIGVVPSRYEPFGFVVIEFMAAGYITIATKGGGCKEIITNNSDGFLCKANSNDLSSTLDRILKTESHDSIQTIALNARKKVNTFFSGIHTIQEYKKVYAKLKINV